MIKQLSFDDIQGLYRRQPRKDQFWILIDALADFLAEGLPQYVLDPIDTLLGRIDYWSTTNPADRPIYRQSLKDLQSTLDQRIRNL